MLAATLGMSLVCASSFAIQGRGNSRNNCLIQPSAAEVQAQNLAEISCKAELDALKCDRFFANEEQRKEFGRQCPTSKETQLNGGDLGVICFKQVIAPTLTSVKGIAAFIASGIRESAENRQRFISECEATPSFKVKIASTIPIFANYTKEQIEQTACPYLVVEFEDNQSRQKSIRLIREPKLHTKNILAYLI